jgi:hypothetical protein
MKAVLIVLILATATASSAQRVTVRVINGKNGQPLGKESVVVQFLGTEAALPATNLQTDTNGEAHFVVPDPAPKSVSVRVALKSGQWRCGCALLADTKTVIEQGTLQTVTGRDVKGVDRKAAQIVFVARPLTFGERLLYPFVKH